MAAKQTKVRFGAINSPTPQWAKWMFRGTSILTTVLSVWVASTGLIQQGAKVELLLAFKSLDLLVLGFSKLFGLVEK